MRIVSKPLALDARNAPVLAILPPDPAPAGTSTPEPKTMIEIEYIVKDQKGVERLRTSDKKAADAYDKALEIADRLAQMLRDDEVVPELADPDMEELTIYLARNAKNVERVLKGKAPEPAAAASDEGGNVAQLNAVGRRAETA